jgi:hypothetical protein
MDNVRRGQPGGGRKSELRWVVWSGALAVVLVGMGASTCGSSDFVVDRCSDVTDCLHLPGTLCNSGFCACPGADEIFCIDACRPIAECGSASSGGAGGGGGSGGVSGAQCKVAADCKQPGDPHCGTASCEAGVCALNLTPFSKIASQIRGDCKNLWCDGDGNLITIEDAGDVFNDGAQCTDDRCEARQPMSTFLLDGTKCSEDGGNVCSEGSCFECVAALGINCSAGLACDGVFCVPPHCVNNVWDQGAGETAKNCGGPCRPCDPGVTCNINADCFYGVCTGATCMGPTCSDGVRNENETGIDCGGPPPCPRCSAGQGCKASSDCLSDVCWAGVCEAPNCTDGIKNGDETEWDCGGSCGPCP